ncbi:uncharacterized protein HKW66_Vig0135730 [Vigna angularis]|uniref:B box-type domain-containing protein n=1 Tax=Phaseolus angularis TaxID=3914 RepID=A0A8T0KFC3_PHAAN|nr:uncharacterized protein HKW66_Vig0135730 [Vigna angularis]
MEESCALCKKRAAMLCDADQAKLCWECDGKVHSANFLVARHSRVLLCRSCHSLTPWKASGTKLTPSISFCQPCLGDRTARLRLLVNDVRQPQKEGENEAPPPSSASATSPPRPAALPLRNHSSSIDSHRSERKVQNRVHAQCLNVEEYSFHVLITGIWDRYNI